MKAWIVNLVLLVAVLGLAMTTPSQARAQLPPAVVSGYRVGNFGTFNLVGLPVYRWHVSPLGFHQVVWYPGAYRLAFTPVGVQQWWTGPMVLNRSFHPFGGWSTQVMAPSHYGLTFSPYATYSQLYIPSRGWVVGYGPIWLSRVNWAGTPSGLMFGTFAAAAQSHVTGKGVVLPANANLGVAKLAAEYQGYVPPQLIIP